MRNLFSLIFLFAIRQAVHAQDIQLVKSEKDPEILTGNNLFQYTAFKQGTVLFRDGSSVSAKMNYHKLVGEMMFIDDNGDSLAIGNPELIRYISIDQDTFYFVDKAYMQLLAGSGMMRLAQKQTLKEVEERRTGAYGSSFTERSDAFNNIGYKVDGRNAGGKPKLQYAPNTRYAIDYAYYLSYRNGEFVLLDKKNVMTVFPDRSKEIRNYIKEHNTNFKSKEEIIQLARYLQSL